MASRVDDAARQWLPRPVAGAKPTHGEFVVLRGITATAVLAFPSVPGVLCLALPVSLALPVGAALVAAGALVTAVCAVACLRHVRPADPAPATTDLDAGLHYDRFAGLVTVHDIRGSVTAIHGRDRDSYSSWMRDPMGRGFVEQIYVSDQIVFFQAIDRLRQGARKATIDLRMEQHAILADRPQFIHMRCEMAALGDADEQVSTFLVQSCDVSEEARLRIEATEQTKLAQSANEAKSRFLAAVSHELRTPLNAILGFSDILSGEYFGKLENDRQREYVSLINRSGAHLLSVVNTMLDMSKIEAGRYALMPEPFRIADAVSACEAMLGLQAREKGVRLTSRVMRDVGEVNADQRAIQQILINLVGNAVKFTDTGGLVTIDAERAGSDLNLIVSDTGIGIAEDKLSLLGQPFVQIDNEFTRKYEGTGLGLSLVKGLVALHGGRFHIRSQPGKGTVITVSVPLDGSGVGVAQAEAEAMDQKMVEFPPRLKARSSADTTVPAVPADRLSLKGATTGGSHDGAQAKTA